MNLRDIRKETGLTQIAAAALVGTTQGAISAWELGRNKPSFDNLCKLADVYKRDITTISNAMIDNDVQIEEDAI